MSATNTILIPHPGQGTFEPEEETTDDYPPRYSPETIPSHDTTLHSFAPPTRAPRPRVKVPPLPLLKPQDNAQSAVTRAHHAWSTAWNSRLCRADNANFIEHFRYTIVASQLLNEYLDHGSTNSAPAPAPATHSSLSLDGHSDDSRDTASSASLYGAAATALAALALVYLLRWTRARTAGLWSNSRIALVLAILAVVVLAAYQYGRRQWLKSLRRGAVAAATDLVTSWQAFELSASSSLSFIQEVELVSKGYRLSTPLPPVSRIEDDGAWRRCARLRKAVNKAYVSTVSACIDACASLRNLIDDDDLERYFDIYDISTEDAKEAITLDPCSVLEDDPESLRSLRVSSYRSGLLRRVVLCSLMALEADGGKPDIHRWQIAKDVMHNLNRVVAESAEKVRQVLSDMEHFNVPITPIKGGHTPSREKVRSQVRKISALSSGIRGLQAKMQILREETNQSIEQSDDLSDLGPNLMAQYESIGADLTELMQAWETGKQSLQSNITRQEHRISLASSNGGFRSPVSSLGGLTAVDESSDGSPAHALKALSGGYKSNRSSMATTPSDEELVFEGLALPKRQRASSTLTTREERIAKMHEERERQAQLRAQRDANTSMLRELETVINLRPKKTTVNGAAARITSI